MIFTTNHSRMCLTAIQLAGKLAPTSVTGIFSGGHAREYRRLASADFPLP